MAEGAPQTDIDGAPRPCGAGIDIGAYEFCDPSSIPPRFLRGDANSDGPIDISDPSAALAFLFLGGPDPRCLAAADADSSGVIEISDPIALLAYLFLAGPPPQAPFPGCGPAPADLHAPLDCADPPASCR